MVKQLHFRIDSSDHARLVDAAKAEETNVSGLMRRIMRLWLRSRAKQQASENGAAGADK
jgi:hypothetical protein